MQSGHTLQRIEQLRQFLTGMAHSRLYGIAREIDDDETSSIV
jgi:hypothetical protein